MLQNFAGAGFVFDQTPLISPPSPPCPCWGGPEGGKGDQKPSYQFYLLCGFTILIMTDTAINETKIHGPCGPSIPFLSLVGLLSAALTSSLGRWLVSEGAWSLP